MKSDFLGNSVSSAPILPVEVLQLGGDAAAGRAGGLHREGGGGYWWRGW